MADFTEEPPAGTDTIDSAHSPAVALQTTCEAQPDEEQPRMNHQSDTLRGDEEEENDDDDDDASLSPEALVLVAMASSAMRSSNHNGITYSYTESVVDTGKLSAANSAIPSEISKLSDRMTIHDDAIVRMSSKGMTTTMDGRQRRHSGSTIPPSPSHLPTRDRHVSLPGAFRATRHTRAEVEDETGVSYDDEDDPSITTATPAVEAMLVQPQHDMVPEGTHHADGELVQGELVESPEIQKIDQQKKRKKWVGWGIFGGVFLVVLAVSVFLSVIFLVLDKKNLDLTLEVEAKGESGKDSDDPSTDPEFVFQGFDRITHHVAYVGWQRPRSCDLLDDEPIVHVECGDGEDDGTGDTVIFVWMKHSLIQSCTASGTHPLFEYECSSRDSTPSDETGGNDPITQVGRVVFSCGTRSSAYSSNSSRRTARAFVGIQQGQCQYSDGSNSDTANTDISIILSLSRICPLTDAGNAAIATNSSSSCHNVFSDFTQNPPRTLDVTLLNQHEVACRRREEPCTPRATTSDDSASHSSCLFSPIDALSVEYHRTSAADDCSSPRLLSDMSSVDGLLASPLEVQTQFFGMAQD